MAEGENLVIGGLLRDNVNEVVKSVPLLGEIPLLGAFFRRTQLMTERTELLIVVRPTLVKARIENPVLPTENFKRPTRQEFFLGGQMQGGAKP
jgi:pilus assembly protein CpaC